MLAKQGTSKVGSVLLVRIYLGKKSEIPHLTPYTLHWNLPHRGHRQPGLKEKRLLVGKKRPLTDAHTPLPPNDPRKIVPS